MLFRSSFINAFGEELMEDNAERAMAAACDAAGASLRNYGRTESFAPVVNMIKCGPSSCSL